MTNKKAASTSLAVEETERREPEEISDEAILAEMVKHEPHELVVRIPPKKSTSIRVRITEVRKAKPRPIEPDPYL